MNQFDVIVDNIMERFRTFNAVDVGIFKICILTLGIIIGVYSSQKIKKLTPHMFAIFVLAYLYVVIKLIRAEVDDLDWD